MVPIQKTSPWSHQESAYEFCMRRQASLLAMDMGTGKSKVAIDVAQNRQIETLLILCPKSVVDVWPGEFEKHCSVPFKLCMLGQQTVTKRAEKMQAFLRRKHLFPGHIHVIVMNYEAAITPIMKSLFQYYYWDMIVLDESHRIKAPGGATSLLCRFLRSQSTYRLCLTGTPMPHSPLDLYAQYRFLDPSVFGSSFVQFRSTFAVMGGYKMKQIMGWKNTKLLERKLSETSFRVKADDVLDLPDTISTKRYCRLSTKARKIYDDVRKHFVAEFEAGRISTDNALTHLLRLQQISNGIVVTDQGGTLRVDDAKMSLLADCMNDIHIHESVVVFCRFHSDLDAVKEVARKTGRGYRELSGRLNQLPEWQSSAHSYMLGVQIQAGGVGIDLTRARYCFYYSTGFSLGDFLQSQKRLHRPGQDNLVEYIHLLTERTIDVAILKVLERREEVVEGILKQLSSKEDLWD